MPKYQSISVSNDYFKRIDLNLKKKEIFDDLKKIPQLSFSEKPLWESRYWGRGVGAFQIEGIYKKIPANIKIQGSKPQISETKILEKLNSKKDEKIKFPQVIFYLPWNDKNGYEIIIFKKINASFIITPHQLAKKGQVEEFFYAYRLYKNFLLKIKPFLEKPKKINYLDNFLKWRKIRLENKLQSLISKKDDEYLLTFAKKLDHFFKKQVPVFQHCHLSIYDIKKSKKNFYLFSNLFWGHRWPYYDAVFGFLWYILGVSRYKKEEILNQINIWEDCIFNLNKIDFDKINFALIEHYLAALNLDILMINKKEEIIKIKEILLEKLKKMRI